MRKNKFDTMSNNEIRKLNSTIIPCFGAGSRIVSGSFLMTASKKLQCHIAIGETNSPKSQSDIERICKKVKMITKADEVYCLGIKVA